ncbi:glycosyltransferase family 4 protein [Kordiimonas marina]|uniref:glycosyltransferase family 4 protein n=1 Tax=Kordiimonas marina TaxID=2872312 RepID=UPI001FF194AE|nr:glycosyltransferase family 4 protein [Kordiimonas marina]
MTKKLRILYHHRIAAQDGQSVHVAELIHAFETLGHTVHMVGPSLRPKEFGAENRFLDWLRRALPDFMLEVMELAYGMRDYLKLKAAYKSFGPDVLYERHNLFLPAGRWLKEKTDLPYLLEVNAPLADERSRYGGLKLEKLARSLERKTWCAADRIFPVSDVLADILKAEGAPENSITVLHNGIDPALYESLDGTAIRQKYGLEGRTVLGFTGFVREWHRLDHMIDLIANYDAADSPHMLIVGDGPAIPMCRERAEKLGIADRIHFAGFIDRMHIPEHLAAMDIALQPAVTDYASPLKLFEYMAAGLAIVAPAQPNICEILEDDKDALLFAPQDFDAADALIRRLIEDAALRARLGAEAKRTIERRHYTWVDNAARISAIAEPLIEARKS